MHHPTDRTLCFNLQVYNRVLFPKFDFDTHGFDVGNFCVVLQTKVIFLFYFKIMLLS